MMTYKVITATILPLFLLSCFDHNASEQDLLKTQVSMLKGLCENEPVCFEKIDTLAESCDQSHANNRDFDTLSERDQMQVIGEFGACIIRQMDQGFQDRFNQAMPVTETGIEINRSSLNPNTKGLMVRLMPDKIRITEKSKQNKDMPLKDLKSFIESQQLADRYSVVILFVDDDSGTGDLVEATDIFKNAGIEDIHVTVRK